MKSDGVITKLVASESLNHLGIDKNGLDSMDYKILEALVKILMEVQLD